MSITATVENGTIRLPEGLHVPDGTRVEISLPAEATPSLLESLKEFVGCIKDGPPDLADEHDHYAHGTPRRKAL